MNILFTCAGRRNYLIKYFKEAIKDKGNIYAADMQNSAPSLVEADKAFIVPSIYEDNYIEFISNICKTENISALISLNDLELPILSRNRELFNKIGVKLIVSSEKVINITFDKYETAKFSKKIGIDTPATYITLDSALNAINKRKIFFPLIIKPRWGSASIGIEIVKTIEELKLSYKLQSIKLKETILAEASKKAVNEAILIQEFIHGQEYGVDIINDLETNYKATIVKKKISMRSGETDKAVTVNEPKLIELGKKIGENLKHIGNLDCDFFFANNKFYLLEMNSRFGGGYPFSHEAGANIPKAIIMWLQNKKADSTLFQVEFNQAFSKYDNLMKIPNDK